MFLFFQGSSEGMVLPLQLLREGKGGLAYGLPISHLGQKGSAGPKASPLLRGAGGGGGGACADTSITNTLLP